MLRLYRKSIFPRWHINRKNSRENKNQGVKCPQQIILCSVSQNHGNSHQNNHKRKHADKKDKRCWDDPQFHFNVLQSSLLETAGWLGTAALYASYRLKQFHSTLDYERINSSCIFSNIVLAMPRYISPDKKSPESTPKSVLSISSKDQNAEKEKVANSVDILESIKSLTMQYAAAVENVAGIENLEKDYRKAFRSFQRASLLGSSQAFYNLGLCYNLGKGTKKNLTRAAFCYRKAAMKGHGLASFNLATFFFKGIGGLPVDTEIAKQLLAQAAEKNVPEAQLYFGIEYLQQKRYPEAVRLFSNLVEKNVSDAQYYLGLCYEDGLGVHKNEKLSFKLFTQSASQGNSKAIQKLETLKKHDNTHSKQNNLHVSASVPELSSLVKKPSANTTQFTISSYLGLITPFLLLKPHDDKSEDDIVANEKIVKEYSTPFLPFSNFSLVMKIKS